VRDAGLTAIALEPFGAGLLTGRLLEEDRRESTLALTLAVFGVEEVLLTGALVVAVEGRAAGRDTGADLLAGAAPGLFVLGTLLFGGPVTGGPAA